MNGEPPDTRSSLFGMLDFRPRLAVVLVFLTITVAVVGFHIYRESGDRRVEAIGQEAMRIFRTPAEGRPPGSAANDPAAIEERIASWTGTKITLPRDEPSFAYEGVERDRIGKRTAAAVRFAVSGESCLLVVLPREGIRGAQPPSSLFSASTFLSWEKDGISFVFWERDGVQYLLVSDADLTHAFELVRQYFT